eukprot:4466461-Amphidinium_carterae.4
MAYGSDVRATRAACPQDEVGGGKRRVNLWLGAPPYKTGLEHQLLHTLRVWLETTYRVGEAGLFARPFHSDCQSWKVGKGYRRPHGVTAEDPQAVLPFSVRERNPCSVLKGVLHWEAGRWSHQLLPFDKELHVFIKCMGTARTWTERAPELNRDLCLELLAVTALGNRKIFILREL